ncbi:MAG TPA: hypothetical protein VMF70_02715 [Gemmatimonadales bacterium]|nr:hypothetical protein [Gemmatimonadales bacterium]
MSMHTRLGLVLMLCAAAAVPLYAQSQQDSLEERLEKAEEAIQRLQHEIESQAQSSVQSRLQNRVVISGLVLFNGFYDGAKFNNADVPEWVAGAQDTTGRPNSQIGGVLRQTRLGITVRPGKVFGGDLSADLQLDFFGAGGGVDSYARLFSAPRIRTANVRIDWPHLGLLFGQEKAIVAQQSPISFAAIGYPEFAGAGNLWNWIPQARLTAEAGRALRVGIQAAALDPVWEPDAAFSTQPDLGERSGRPAVEGRLYLDWGADEKESTIGFGAHRGWIATAGTGTIASQALTADFRVVVGIVTLAGQAFTGQVLNMLGDGGIAQDLGPLGQPVRSRGGWAQLDLRPSFAWEFGGGYGRDDPTNSDLLQSASAFAPGARLLNAVYEGHLHWRPGGGLLIGAEYRRFETTFPAGVLKADHVNMFAGVFF